MKALNIILMMMLTLLFSACSSRDDSSDSTTTATTATTTTSNVSPTLSITSHQDAQTIVGDLNITLVGSVSDSDGTVQLLTIQLNDETAVEVSLVLNAFSYDFELISSSTLITLVAKDDAGESTSSTLTLNRIAQGELDTSFGNPDGFIASDLYSNATATSIAIDSQGRIYATGFARQS